MRACVCHHIAKSLQSCSSVASRISWQFQVSFIYLPRIPTALKICATITAFSYIPVAVQTWRSHLSGQVFRFKHEGCAFGLFSTFLALIISSQNSMHWLSITVSLGSESHIDPWSVWSLFECWSSISSLRTELPLKQENKSSPQP